MARWGGRNEGKAAAQSLRALRLLATAPATQLVDRPLSTLKPLIADGYAEVSQPWDEIENGKRWRCEKVYITQLGRDFLARLERQS